MQRYTDLGNRLTELLGSQTQIAEVLGVSQVAVSHKLTGKTAITLADLEKIRKALHVPMSIFFELKGTDGGVLRAFHEMHMRNPQALDSIINAYWHNSKTLTMLAEVADRLVKEVEPGMRRRDRINRIGVADNDIAIPLPPGMEEESDEGKDDSEAHHGIESDEGGDPRSLGRPEAEVGDAQRDRDAGLLEGRLREVPEQEARPDGLREGHQAEPQVGDGGG